MVSEYSGSVFDLNVKLTDEPLDHTALYTRRFASASSTLKIGSWATLSGIDFNNLVPQPLDLRVVAEISKDPAANLMNNILHR